MSTRLVTILGLGTSSKGPTGYDPVAYSFEGRSTERVTLVSRAIAELFAPVDAVVVLGTPEVRAQRHETGAIANALSRPYHFMEVPRGQDDAERWALFEALRRALDLAPIAEAGEAGAPTRVLFDVTHGYRTQPLFAMAVLAYMQSEWARRGDEAPEVRVLYGAFDPQQQRPDVPAPLWDLTQHLTVTRWNAALDALQRFGRADDLEALARAESAAQTAAARRAGATGSALAPAGVARRFGALARSFADDLALARFAGLLTGADGRGGSAAQLRAFLQGPEMAGLVARLPVLRDSIGRLAAWLAPLHADRIESPAGVRALAAFAGLAVRLQRYAEAAAAVREGLVTAHALARGAPVPHAPGASGYHEARLAAERAIERAGAAPLERLFANTTGPRNDLLHGGLNDQPLAAKHLRDQVTRLTEEFAALDGAEGT